MRRVRLDRSCWAAARGSMPLRSDQYISHYAIRGSFDRWVAPTPGDATGTNSSELDIKSIVDGQFWQRLLSLPSKLLSATHAVLVAGRIAFIVLVRRRSAESLAAPSKCSGLCRITDRSLRQNAWAGYVAIQMLCWHEPKSAGYSVLVRDRLALLCDQPDWFSTFPSETNA